MKRRNLVIAAMLSLSVAMLTACGGSEESKETTSKKTEIESSIIMTDKDTTEEETTKDDTTTENTTVVVDNETTGEETTTKVDETSKQETTTKKQETTTAKPTTTQKETTTKKQETTTAKPTTTQKETTTKQPQTTTKEEQTTTKEEETTTKQPQTTTEEEQTTKKEEETTTEVWNKTVYEDAAINLINLIDNGGKSQGFNGYFEYTDMVVFEDLNLDGVPELLLLGYNFITCGNLYMYSNGEYVWYSDSKAYAQKDTKLYKNNVGEIIIVEKGTTPDYTEDWEKYYDQERISLYNVTKNERVGLVAKVTKYDGTVIKYQQWFDQPNMVGALDITKEEYDSLYSEGMSGLTYYKDTYGTQVDIYDVDEAVKSAYKIYN